MEKSLFTKGMVIGALVGGALTLLHKPTRNQVMTKVTDTTKTIYHYVASPEEVVDKFNDKKDKLVDTYTSISSDVHFILDKINEFKEYKNS